MRGNRNVFLLGALVVAVAFGVGYTAWSPAPLEGGSRDTWPLTQCPPPPAPKGTSTAKDKLDAISDAAMAANPPTAESDYCMQRAQDLQAFTPSDPVAASGHVYAAWNAVQAGDWVAGGTELDGID